MVSSEGTSVSSNSFSRWASHDIFLFKYHFLLHILRFLFFVSDNIVADVASKQQTTALFLSTIVTRTRRHTELTKKLTNLMGNLCCFREHSVQSFVQFFYTAKLHSFNLECMRPFIYSICFYLSLHLSFCISDDLSALLSHTIGLLTVKPANTIWEQYLLKPTNCTYLSNHLKPHYWIKMDLKYLLHVSIPLWDHPQGA